MMTNRQVAWIVGAILAIGLVGAILVLSGRASDDHDAKVRRYCESLLPFDEDISAYRQLLNECIEADAYGEVD